MPNAKAYRVETRRLVIRCFQPVDAQPLLDAITVSKEHLSAWMPWAKNEPTSLDVKVDLLRQFRGEFDMGIDYKFGIFNKGETEVVGSTGLHTRIGEGGREIGFWINIKYVNKGFALEAASALTKIAFEVEQQKRVEIHCATENIYSQKIPQKLGFHLDGVLRNRTLNGDSIPKDRMIWTMFRNEYEASVIKNAEVKAFDVLGREIEMGGDDE
jgi:RimJ/RimL family protein N-acetyltransferase